LSSRSICICYSALKPLVFYYCRCQHTNGLSTNQTHVEVTRRR